MKVLEGGGQLGNDGGGLDFVELGPFVDLVEEMTSFGLFEYEVELVRFFKIVDQLDYGVVGALAQIVELDLFEHLLAVEGPTVLVDNLDSVFPLGVHVHAALHSAAAALAQNIIFEVVEVTKAGGRHGAELPFLFLVSPGADAGLGIDACRARAGTGAHADPGVNGLPTLNIEAILGVVDNDDVHLGTHD